MGFGENIRALRMQQGFTQTQLSEMLGVSQAVYAQYELSGKVPNVFTAVKLARILGTTVEELVFGENYRKENTPS